MRENRLSGSEGGGSKLNCFSLPLFEPLFSVRLRYSVTPCFAVPSVTLVLDWSVRPREGPLPRNQRRRRRLTGASGCSASRAIITSVDLTIASAESPRRSFSSLSASLVTTAVSI